MSNFFYWFCDFILSIVLLAPKVLIDYLPLNDNTKILTETDTETFFTIPNFPKPKPILFFRDQIFRNRNQDFFPRPIFSQTKTDTFFSATNFFWNRNRDFFSETKFFETETLKNLAKVSRPRPKPRLLNIFWNEIWDLQAELGLIWDHFRSLVPIRTKSQIWDITTSTIFVIWIFSFPRPIFPKPRVFSETKFFRNWNRDFFSETKFYETETETLKDLAKVLKPRSFETKMSISAGDSMCY